VNSAKTLAIQPSRTPLTYARKPDWLGERFDRATARQFLARSAPFSPAFTHRSAELLET
jgi:hypothetical protein